MNLPQDSITTINDLETLKVISDPLRLNILQIVRDTNRRGEPCSVKQIAEVLDMPPAKLYYHVRLLEKHDLLQVADTRLVSGIVEKRYRVRALQFNLSSDLLADPASSGSITAMCANLFNNTLKEIGASLDRHGNEAFQRRFSLSTYRLALTPERLQALNRQLEGVLKEYIQTSTDEDKESPDLFSMLLVTYPLEMMHRQEAN